MALKYCARLGPKGWVVPIGTLTLTTTTFMGRCTRHLTADAKASARRQSDLLYSHSPHGKFVRATSRQLKQHRKVTQTPPTDSLDHIPGLKPLSPELVALNELPLPESNPLFQAVLTAASWIDVLDLPRWKKQPPFEEDDDHTDPYSAQYLRYSENIAVVLHGDRMRAQNEQDVQRRTEFHAAGAKQAMDRLSLQSSGPQKLRKRHL
ncbi:hypothetical protein DFH08DRAFT_816335 [Mycena albidolilacea]|uniref:Uncharacterized protein n=1 Tax=Mycena albidolilacea TaxID=1033008 RepID=A0AAD7EI41_9AGAR|nr:hypothetical protein DFH08DRAFT_816335 [Mycena albidolilacea]